MEMHNVVTDEKSPGLARTSRFRPVPVPFHSVADTWSSPAIAYRNSQGLRESMEDYGVVVGNLVQVPLVFQPGDRVVPVALGKEKGLWALWEDGCASPRSTLTGFPSGAGAQGLRHAEVQFHFAGVYDGHGGPEVARQVAENLHLHVREAFSTLIATSLVECVDGTAQGDDVTRQGQSDATGRPKDGHRWGLTLPQVSSAIGRAFRLMDGQLRESGMARDVGSTAVVALVSGSHLCVANCGDSRAVLSRGGAAYRLSRDHKPDLEDEEARIRACGGEVLNYGGSRVMGVLAMSRALGDHWLSDFGITAEPEVMLIEASPEDDFLILASDGLWDVLTDSEAVSLIRECFQRAEASGADQQMCASLAGRVLIKAALHRGSRDNITVTIVDLRGNCKH
ncbi:unnamed protein product [Ostreobium quekettii]|uniref:protein-serine/threonine phosphatase n=1 Tax=Ostreobium quekettii TaxID=121088 RepID=A0A8S1IL21_9CHLO|nr:unnamed protein product [Ostreobium quekettii]